MNTKIKILIFLFIFCKNVELKVKDKLWEEYERKKDINITTSRDLYIRLESGEVLIGNRKIVRIKGSNNIITKNIVYEFLGLPFGEIPIREKRYQFAIRLNKLFDNNPTQHQSNGNENKMIYNATYYRPSCMQEYDLTFGSDFYGSMMWNPPYNRSEDCLYFNIWIPVSLEQDELIYINESSKYKSNINDINYIKNAFLFDTKKDTNYIINDDEKKSTLFWIYGGSFNSGSSNLKITDGTLLSTLENVIVITSNYRVGPFGFLYLNNSKVPGNAGLSDQIMAIEWYRDKYMNLFI